MWSVFEDTSRRQSSATHPQRLNIRLVLEEFARLAKGREIRATSRDGKSLRPLWLLNIEPPYESERLKYRPRLRGQAIRGSPDGFRRLKCVGVRKVGETGKLKYHGPLRIWAAGEQIPRTAKKRRKP